METGTYLTEITPNRDIENNINIPAKFIRFTFTQTMKQNSQTDNIKKLNTVNRRNNANSYLPDEYYSIKRVKPGIAFYKDILQAQFKKNSENKIHILNLNIPQTLVFHQNSLQLIYSKNGMIKINSHITYQQFLRITKEQKIQTLFQKQSTEMQQKNTNQNVIYPAVLTGIGNGVVTDFSVILSNQLDVKILPRNQNQVSMKFIRPYGKCPNILRLFYIPKSVKGNKPNYAYKSINKKKIDEQTLVRKHKQTHNFLVDFNKEQNIITTLVKGKALNQVEIMTQSIVDFLQQTKQSKIMEIVVDYIFGQDRVYYFHQIKSIKSVAVSTVWNTGTPEQIQQKHRQQNNQIYCRLCGFFFPKLQITKLVTNKLIIQLISHLKSRGQRINFNNNCKTFNLSGSSNVCDLCYELIVAQHQLINIQQQFCSLINITSDNLNRVKQISGFNIPLFCQQQTQMIKWRVFFYIQKIKNIPFVELENCISLSMKFSDVKQNFYQKFKNQEIHPDLSRIFSGKSSHLRSSTKSFRGFSSKNQKKPTLHTTCTNRSYDNSKQNSTINFQKVRIITFYTKNDQIKSILSNEDVSFQLTYKNYKYKGQTATLQNFGNTKQCQRYSCEVLLFDKKYTYCNLQLNVGLICDGYFSTASLSLQKSNNNPNIYLSNTKNQTCSPLPAQWMQIISQGIEIQPQQTPKIQNKSKSNIFRVQSGHIFKSKLKSHINSPQNINQSQQEQLQQYL